MNAEQITAEKNGSGLVADIREVLGYLGRYRDQIFVIKIEDLLLEKPLFSVLVKDIVLLHKMGIKVVVVPGAKKSIDDVLATYGENTQSRQNIRITSESAMPLVQLGAAKVTNNIISLLSENGIHGVVGNWVSARAMGVIDGVDFLQTGSVEKVNISLIRNMLDDQLVPIIPNLGWNAVGTVYNLSSSELASEVAVSLQASKLFFISDLAGIQSVKGYGSHENLHPDGKYSNLDIEAAEALLKDPESLKISGNPDPRAEEYLKLSVNACKWGVDRVHIIDGSQDGALLTEIFSSKGAGTMFHGNEHANILPAKVEDIPEILRIMQPYVNQKVMVQRTMDDIIKDLENYAVHKVDDTLHGCGALRIYEDQKAEIEALVVDSTRTGRGTGKKIVSYLLEKAKKQNVRTVFILTTQSSDFFMRLGFRDTPRDFLPPSKKHKFNHNRNSRVLSIRV